MEQGADIITKSDGTPFQSQAAASSGITKMGLDPSMHSVVQIEGGWGIRQGNGDPRPAEGSAPKEEGYWLVRFHPKSVPTDKDDVELFVNGECLLAARDVETIVPDRFLDAADHAIRPVFKQEPGKTRKTVGWVATYNYTKIRQATKAEFETMRRAGNKKMRAVIAKFGYDHSGMDEEE